jgi:hypothetical protein
LPQKRSSSIAQKETPPMATVLLTIFILLIYGMAIEIITPLLLPDYPRKSRATRIFTKTIVAVGLGIPVLMALMSMHQ